MDDFFERWPRCEKCGKALYLTPCGKSTSAFQVTYTLYCASCLTSETVTMIDKQQEEAK